MTCASCGKKDLTRDEIGLTRKLINRGAEECFCLRCLAERFRVTEQQLTELAQAFRENGCSLFA